MPLSLAVELRGRRDRGYLIVTVAVPACFSWLCTTAPKNALSPTREEAREGRRQQQRLVDADLALAPSRSARRLSPATAMMRYVVSDSGSVTSVVRVALARR